MVISAQMPRPLARVVGGPDDEGRGVGGADGDAGRAIVAFLPAAVAQGIEPRKDPDQVLPLTASRSSATSSVKGVLSASMTS